MAATGMRARDGAGFTYDPAGELGAAHAAIDAYIAQCAAIEAARSPGQGGTYQEQILVDIHHEAVALVARSESSALLRAALDRLAWLDEHGRGVRGARHGEGPGAYLHVLARRLVERRPGLSVADLRRLLAVVNAHVLPVPRYRDVYQAHWYFWLFIAVLPRAASTPERITPLLDELRGFLDWAVWYTFFPLMRRQMLDYADVVDDFPTGYIGAGEGWADLARADLRAMDMAQRDAWHALFADALRAEETSAFIPPAAWLTAARPHVDAITSVRYAERAGAWFARLAQPNATVLCDQHVLILRTILWGLYHCPATPALADVVADVAVTGYRTVPAHTLGHKPKGHCSTALGRACLAYLERIVPAVALPALSRIAATPPSPRAQKAIAAALARTQRQAR